MSQADFNAYPFEADNPPEGTLPIRNITETGFDLNGGFEGVGGWQTYDREPDPYGYFD